MAETPSRSVVREFTSTSFLWRMLFSLLLVFATYNPSEFSYFHWLRESLSGGGLAATHFVVGMILIIGWTIMLVAAQRSLGTIGLVLGAILLGGIVWMLADFGLVALDSVSALAWVGLFSISILLAVGLSWSHIWRRVTGQYEVDDD